MSEEEKEKITLIELVKQRPVVYDVLGHYLHNTTEEIRREQNYMLYLVSFIREMNKRFDISQTELNFGLWNDFKVIIFISVKATLGWIHTHYTHEWYQPILRLLRVLDGEENVPPEPHVHAKVEPEVLDDGTYIIRKGCYELIKGEYCNGDMIMVNHKWHDHIPTPLVGSTLASELMYVCQKCNHVKIV